MKENESIDRADAPAISDYRPERIMKAKRLLEEKYHQEFEILQYKGQQAFDHYYTVLAYSKGRPDLVFSAGVSVEEDGISDSYGAKRVAERISEQIARNLNEIPGTVFVHTEFMIRDLPVENLEIPLQQLGPQVVSVSVFVSGQDGEKPDRSVFKTNIPKEITQLAGIVRIYDMNEETLSWVGKYLEEHDKRYGDFDEKVRPYLCFTGRLGNGAIIAEEDVRS